MSFKNKVVIVTGAGSGIGAATAVMFCKEGANVVLVGRNEVKLENVAKKCATAPMIIKGDVSNDDDAKRIVEDTIRKCGKLDILVNNAGILRYGSILNGKILEAYDEMMGVNLRAVVHLTMLAAPHLVKTKGNIVNISSVAGQMQLTPEYVAYCTSKAGADHFTRGAALELASSGVRVNAISPGPVVTDFLKNSGASVGYEAPPIPPPLGRISESEEIADLVLYLASDKARGITGSVYVTDNGCILKHAN